MKKNSENYILTKLQKIVSNKIEDKLKDFPRYIVEIGIFKADTAGQYINSKGEIVSPNNKRENVGLGDKAITHAEILFFMEYGAPTLNIPERPVLQQTVEWAKQNLLQSTIEKGLAAYFKTGKIESFELEVQKLCMRMESHVKTGIRRKQFDIAPNALSTIEAKGSDIPLLDTGQLANAIQCVYKKIK